VSATPVLTLDGLTVTYGRGVQTVRAVRGVDLTINAGELVGLVGESGCGKSSLAMAMLGLLPPESATVTGRALIGDTDLVTATDAELRHVRWQRVSLVPQSAMNALSPVLRIGEQISDVVRAHGRISKRRALETAVEALRRVGLGAQHAASYPHELSGGMRQRAVIAMAIALQPDVVVMDEPTTALDVVTQRLVLDQVTDLSRKLGFATILITHDLPILLEWAQRILVMYAGSIVESGTPDQMVNGSLHPYTQMLLESFPPLTGERRELATIPGQPWDLRRVADQCPFADRCPSVMDVCRQSAPRLEAVGDRATACFLGQSARADRIGKL
jgi:peptide/nickel transport system ATP-binding protein